MVIGDDNRIKMEYNLIYDNHGNQNQKEKIYQAPKDYVVNKTLRHFVVHLRGYEGGVQRPLQKVKGVPTAKKQRANACFVQSYVRP